MTHSRILAVLVGVTLLARSVPATAADKPLKVFVLAGQSNMQGHANVSTFDSLADDPETAPLLKEMRTPDGKPRVCEKVWITSVGCLGDRYTDLNERKGKLTVGFGASNDVKIGPEFTFGITVEKMLGEPILIIKTSWGGRSLHTDFRPPSGGPYVWSDSELNRFKQRGDDLEKIKAEKIKATGLFYRHMIDHVQKVLKDIKRVVPEYDEKRGYELAGFVWFQGFNDLVDSGVYPNQMKPGGYDLYGELMAHFIRDVRKDLSAPKMPFVIGVLGVGGLKEGKKGHTLHFRQAQAAPASLPEFKGNVVAVDTAPFWDDDLNSLHERMEKFNAKLNVEFKKKPGLTREEKEAAREKAIGEDFKPEELKRYKAGVSNGGYHYLGAAKILAPIGKAFAEALVGVKPVKADKPVKVFVLAGQSNMEGFGLIKADPKRNDGKGSLEYLTADKATADKYKHLLGKKAGEWAVRDDVWIHYLDRKGKLTVGYGAKEHLIGPELGFGSVIGDAYEEPVLLIKLAWGGKSLAVDFRPPSSGGEVGPYYKEIVERTKAVLKDLKKEFPEFADRGYELAGFGWHQGWNDRVNQAFTDEYFENMVNFIRNIRRDLRAPKLPFVIAETGMGGKDEKNPRALALMKAQADVAAKGGDLLGNVAFVGTREFWREKNVSPLDANYHWNNNAETYYLIGEAMGTAMKTLIATKQPDPKQPDPKQPDPKQPAKAEMAGYLLVPNSKVDKEYNAGFSLYVAAWPLLKHYPGQDFQSGLFGTWMFGQFDGPAPKKHYSDIEGGLGWWRDTRFATETPKFIMGGVALNFSEWANGPGAGKGRDWKNPAGKYAVAQLSPWVLWPPDGLNLKQGTNGELFGYGYLPLPLTSPKKTTAGKDVPTGDHCWTLFLNTGNFKGPVTFFTPYFWSRPSAENSKLSGLFLDTLPSDPNRALQMETQHIPAYLSQDAKGDTYARIAPTQFPGKPDADVALIHRITAYKKAALWDGVKAWFDGGKAVTGEIDPKAASVHKFDGKGGSSWEIYPPNTKEKKVPLAWSSFATPVALDDTTYGYKWTKELLTKADAKAGSHVTLPEYYRLEKGAKDKEQWVVVLPKDVPAETGLGKVAFPRAGASSDGAYTTPDTVDSCWKKPGPAAGPFTAKLGDGSVVTYFWYRFADQPALLNADMTAEEREGLQKRVELLHKNWTKDREYLPPPKVGSLADLDPSVLVTPPKGLEIGYVPIVTRQGMKE